MNEIRYGRKEVTLAGKTFVYQRWENHAIQKLLDKGVKAERIITTCPEGKKTFRYEDKQGNSRLYVPDIQFRHKGKDYFVEVKSTYTAGWLPSQQTTWYRVLQKAKAVENAGYTFLFCLVLSKKGDTLWANGVAATRSLRRRYAKRLQP